MDNLHVRNMITGYKIFYQYKDIHNTLYTLTYYTDNMSDEMMDIEISDSGNIIIIKDITSCIFNASNLHMCFYN